MSALSIWLHLPVAAVPKQYLAEAVGPEMQSSFVSMLREDLYAEECPVSESIVRSSTLLI